MEKLTPRQIAAQVCKPPNFFVKKGYKELFFFNKKGKSMSNYCTLYCKDCQESSELEINRGQEVILDLVRRQPEIVQLVKTIQEANLGPYSDVTITIMDRSFPTNFILQHAKHKWACKEEYGIIPW